MTEHPCRLSAQRMKHRKKGEEKQKISRDQRDRELENNVVEHSAAVLTCATEAADEFVTICDRSLENLEEDLVYLRLALEIWAQRPELAQPLRHSLEELLLILTNHDKAIRRLKPELKRLAADPAPHVHLDPVEQYRQLVRERLFTFPPAG
jgi:NAD(P)H-hydrate repair Nnr-like enzyme with NAD(P)H-hydrate dehydratase domain